MPRNTKPTRNAEVDFKGEKQSNATHASSSYPDGRQQSCPATTVAGGMKGKMDPRARRGRADRLDPSAETDWMTEKHSRSATISATC